MIKNPSPKEEIVTCPNCGKKFRPKKKHWIKAAKKGSVGFG